MAADDREEFVQQLITPTLLPSGFKRQNPKAFRFSPYSRKAKRTLDIYTPLAFDLWIHCEWDIGVKDINERVNELTFPGEGCTLLKVRPSMVTVNYDGHISIHLISSPSYGELTNNYTAFNEKTRSLQLYLDRYSIALSVWTSEILRKNPIELENWQQLLAYTIRPGLVISPAFREKILLVIKQARKITIRALLEGLPDEDPEWVMRALAILLQESFINSDIAQHLLSDATELSVYHEFT